MLPKVLNIQITVYYGFAERCEETEFPDHDSALGCRPFPTKDSDGCDRTYRSFCTLWSTAGYISYLAIGFGAVACAAIVFGVSTHSRRKRIWKVVATLVALHGTCKSSSSCSARSPIPLTLGLDARTCLRSLATGNIHPCYRRVPFRELPPFPRRALTPWYVEWPLSLSNRRDVYHNVFARFLMVPELVELGPGYGRECHHSVHRGRCESR